MKKQVFDHAFDRESIDGIIAHLISTKEGLIERVKKLSKKLRRFRQREEFLRELMRTHSRFPERGETWHQIFFSNADNEAVLIKELQPPDSLMPNMNRISIKDAKTGPKIGGKPSFVLHIDPCYDFCSPDGHRQTYATLGRARHAINKEEIDSFIDFLIREKKRLFKQTRKLSKKIQRCKKCEEFLRGLLRTHTHYPERRDMRPMYFFQDKEGRMALDKRLIKEWIIDPSEDLLPFLAENLITELGLPSSDERLLPNMERVRNRDVRTAVMKNGKEGVVLCVDPGHDFEKGHFKILVDFRKIRWEKWEEPTEEIPVKVEEEKKEEPGVLQTLFKFIFSPIFDNAPNRAPGQ